jgi:hypothetical protein
MVPEFEPPLQHRLEEVETERQIENAHEVSQGHEGVELRRSSRTRRPPSHLKDYITNERDITQAVQALMANMMDAESKQDFIAYETLHSPAQENFCEQDPIAVAMKSIMDPDTLYLWEARKEPVFPKFLESNAKGSGRSHERRALEAHM